MTYFPESISLTSRCGRRGCLSSSSPDQRLPTPAEDWPAPSESSPTANVLHMEMPRFNERKHGLPYRFVWGIGSPDSSPVHVSGIVKVDLGDPTCSSAPGADSHLPINAPCLSWYRASHYPSEPIFVPRPGAMSEDDGVVLSVMLDGKRGKSYLLVLKGSRRGCNGDGGALASAGQLDYHR